MHDKRMSVSLTATFGLTSIQPQNNIDLWKPLSLVLGCTMVGSVPTTAAGVLRERASGARIGHLFRSVGCCSNEYCHGHHRERIGCYVQLRGSDAPG